MKPEVGGRVVYPDAYYTIVDVRGVEYTVQWSDRNVLICYDFEQFMDWYDTNVGAVYYPPIKTLLKEYD